MTVLDSERWAGYEAAWPGHHRQPFAGVEQHARVITRADAGYAAWAPEDSVTQPVWCYVSTHRVNAGTFYVQPKEWFDPGNHPGPEPYYSLRGTLLLGNPDTADVIEINAGDAANIPAFAYHIAYNLGDSEAEILWWVPGEMHRGVEGKGPQRGRQVVRARAGDPARTARPQRGVPFPPRRPRRLAA